MVDETLYLNFAGLGLVSDTELYMHVQNDRPVKVVKKIAGVYDFLFLPWKFWKMKMFLVKWRCIELENVFSVIIPLFQNMFLFNFAFFLTGTFFQV